MTYDEAIGFWYGRVNFEVRSAQPVDLKLERMRALLRLLGDPHDRLRLVHVTGTKGKGSTCAMLAAVLRAAGYRVGLFTSPHLERVEERIQVDGVPISHSELAARMAEVAHAVRILDGEPSGGLTSPGSPGITFFEIGTALGFLHFCYRRCDVAVIEVGLGGRFDSTNVCHPLVSVIANVGLDHTAQLGNTVEEIAYQKAGIIKRRVPVVSGVTQPGAREVVRRIASEEAAPLSEPLRESERVPQAGSLLAPARLPGRHQRDNAAVALATIDRLRKTGMSIPDRALRAGFATAYCPGRVELISRNPTVILDTAHNVPSAEALVQALRETFPTSGRKVVIFAVSSDKDSAEILRVLADYFDHFCLTKYGNNPRSVPPEKLAAILSRIAPGKSFICRTSAGEAWAESNAAAGKFDLICVAGSVFLAGELRPFLDS